MKLQSLNRRLRAFTRIELTVALAVGMVLALLVLPAARNARLKAQRISCVCRLKQIGLSFRIWSGDTNVFPMRLSTNFGGTKEFTSSSDAFRHFQVISNELVSPLILVCPSDTRKPARDFISLSNTNLSYFIALDADESRPQMLLSGDRNLTGAVAKAGGILVASPDKTMGWNQRMHKRNGNVALADGSVQQVTSAKFMEQVRNSGDTNRLLFP